MLTTEAACFETLTRFALLCCFSLVRVSKSVGGKKQVAGPFIFFSFSPELVFTCVQIWSSRKEWRCFCSGERKEEKVGKEVDLFFRVLFLVSECARLVRFFFFFVFGGVKLCGNSYVMGIRFRRPCSTQLFGILACFFALFTAIGKCLFSLLWIFYC